MLMQWDYNDIDIVWRRAHSSDKKDEVEGWLDHVEPEIMTL